MPKKLLGWDFWRVVEAAAGILFFSLVAISCHHVPHSRSGSLSVDDANAILMRGHLGSAKVVRVLQNSQLGGDVHGIQINTCTLLLNDVPTHAFTYQSSNGAPFLWKQPPLRDSILQQALVRATEAARNGDPTFPDTTILNEGSRFFLCLPRLSLRDMNVDSVEMLAYDRTERKLYYVNSQN